MRRMSYKRRSACEGGSYKRRFACEGLIIYAGLYAENQIASKQWRLASTRANG